MLVALKAAFIENYLVVSTWNLHGSSTDSATRRSINLLVDLVFDLDAGRFKFWVKICLALEWSRMSFLPLTLSYNVL